MIKHVIALTLFVAILIKEAEAQTQTIADCDPSICLLCASDKVSCIACKNRTSIITDHAIKTGNTDGSGQSATSGSSQKWINCRDKQAALSYGCLFSSQSKSCEVCGKVRYNVNPNQNNVNSLSCLSPIDYEHLPAKCVRLKQYYNPGPESIHTTLECDICFGLLKPTNNGKQCGPDLVTSDPKNGLSEQEVSVMQDAVMGNSDNGGVVKLYLKLGYTLVTETNSANPKDVREVVRLTSDYKLVDGCLKATVTVLYNNEAQKWRKGKGTLQTCTACNEPYGYRLDKIDPKVPSKNICLFSSSLRQYDLPFYRSKKYIFSGFLFTIMSTFYVLLF